MRMWATFVGGDGHTQVVIILCERLKLKEGETMAQAAARRVRASFCIGHHPLGIWDRVPTHEDAKLLHQE